MITNGDEVISEISINGSVDDCSEAAVFSCDVSFGVKEANRSIEETRVHNLLDLFVVPLALELVVGANTLVVFSSISSVLSLPLTLL